MKSWSFYDPKDGLFTGYVVTGSGTTLVDNLPPHLRAIEGRYNRLSQRIDLATGEVVDYVPPQPDDDHEWRAENPDAPDRASQRWRWVKRADVLEREARQAQARARIQDLEAQQHRRVRELLAASDAQLAELDQQIAEARGLIE